MDSQQQARETFKRRVWATEVAKKVQEIRAMLAHRCVYGIGDTSRMERFSDDVERDLDEIASNLSAIQFEFSHFRVCDGLPPHVEAVKEGEVF